jgi:hypothetical protein
MSDEGLVFWLNRFSDSEIAAMGVALCGVGSVEAVVRWRARLALTASDRARCCESA